MDAQAAGEPIIDSLKQSHVHYLIGAYRAIGHLQAHLDPLGQPPPPAPKLGLAQFHLSEDDLDTAFDVGTYLGGGQMRLRDVIASLQETYCGHVGVEYAHIQDQDCRLWLQERIESTRLIAGLARFMGDVSLAEDLAHDAPNATSFPSRRPFCTNWLST